MSHWGFGACLADDMGLGKTIQTIAILNSRASQGPQLVIAPTSVCYNWQKEIVKITDITNSFNQSGYIKTATLFHNWPQLPDSDTDGKVKHEFKVISIKELESTNQSSNIHWSSKMYVIYQTWTYE